MIKYLPERLQRWSQAFHLYPNPTNLRFVFSHSLTVFLENFHEKLKHVLCRIVIWLALHLFSLAFIFYSRIFRFLLIFLFFAFLVCFQTLVLLSIRTCDMIFILSRLLVLNKNFFLLFWSLNLITKITPENILGSKTRSISTILMNPIPCNQSPLFLR